MCTHWFGLLFVFGMIALFRRHCRWRHRRCHRDFSGGFPGEGGGWHEHHHHHGRHGGFWHGRLDWIFSDLHLTAEQERVVREILKEMKERAGAVRNAATTIRSDLAGALRSEGFDEVAAGELLGNLDESLEQARKQMIDLLARLHQVLDPSQRARLADYLEGRLGWQPPFWR